MFLQASVCQQGGCLPQCILGYHIPPRSRHHPPEQTPPPGRDGHCCGRYTSYWNAFSFSIDSSAFSLLLLVYFAFQFGKIVAFVSYGMKSVACSHRHWHTLKISKKKEPWKPPSSLSKGIKTQQSILPDSILKNLYCIDDQLCGNWLLKDSTDQGEGRRLKLIHTGTQKRCSAASQNILPSKAKADCQSLQFQVTRKRCRLTWQNVELCSCIWPEYEKKFTPPSRYLVWIRLSRYVYMVFSVE